MTIICWLLLGVIVWGDLSLGQALFGATVVAVLQWEAYDRGAVYGFRRGREKKP